MSRKKRKARIGIIGCGAIGSRIAQSVARELRKECRLTALYDIDELKAKQLAARLSKKGIVKTSVTTLLKSCDLVVESISATNTQAIIRQALQAKKHVLAMSVGKLLNAKSLFTLAQKNNCSLLLPSGAIAGVDALKAAGLAGIFSITLTTRKPISGFKNNAYISRKKINLSKLKKETTIFDGSVNNAVKFFPKNINVAATLALASQAGKKLRIKITTSPKLQTNSHEVEIKGRFGKMLTRTENLPCPDNPKTSYLAVLSGIQTLKQFFNKVKIGT